MYTIYKAHFHDCSKRCTHYHPDRPYDHFIDHSQLPGSMLGLYQIDLIIFPIKQLLTKEQKYLRKESMLDRSEDICNYIISVI